MSILDEAHRWCIHNDYRISPIASKTWGFKAKSKEKSYHIGVSTPENWKKVYKSPEIYGEDEIWDKVSETEQFYYDKHR